MSHSLCVLAAGLLVGQTQDVTIVPSPAKCNCGSSRWTQMPTSSQTRAWTQTGTWTSSGSWTGRNSVSSGEDRPILSRISDRLGDLFGSRPEASRQSSGWQSTGWFQDDVQDRQVLPVHSVPGYLVMPLGTETAEPPVIQRTPAPKVSLSEPPLLELTADAPVALPAQPLSVEPASFQPPQVVAPAPNK